MIISIHAPPRGATRRYVRRLEVQYQFQFTPLREGRRGATGTALYRDNFNSRPSARGDDRKREFAERVLLFQFTPLREGRLQLRRFRRGRRDFNSRPSARGDGGRGRPKKTKSEISIHAPPRGATSWVSLHQGFGEFQFTPLREGRRCVVLCAGRQRSDFNSRPSARGDNCASAQLDTGNHFNSRPSARGDRTERMVKE